MMQHSISESILNIGLLIFDFIKIKVFIKFLTLFQIFSLYNICIDEPRLILVTETAASVDDQVQPWMSA